MKALKIRILIFFLLITSYGIHAQEVLTYGKFIEQLLTFHPVAKQTELRVGQAREGVRAAKGAFDPAIVFDHDQKVLKDKQYYNYSNVQANYQTPFAVKIKAGIDNSAGNYINPELTNGRLGYFGIEMPLLKGLLIDYKRAELKNAEIFVNQTEQQKRTFLNNLALEASEMYWEWWGKYRVMSNLIEYQTNAEKRLNLTKILFENGDRALIDTVEATTQLQNVRLQLNQAIIEYYSAGINLGRFMWNQDGLPYFLSEKTIPDTTSANLLKLESKLLAGIDLNNHPDLRDYELKIEGLNVYKNLKKQSLLPELNLKANVLSSETSALNFFGNNINENYKLGVGFKVPLLLREARGEYRMAELKVRESVSAFDQKKWEINTKVSAYDLERTRLTQQIKLLENLIENNEKLLENEDLKFKQGESSLFLINSRENKILETIQKKFETQVKYNKTLVKQLWAGGILTEI
ncbi:MAG: TolC family protein [Bacteroidetes bacterium]|nr:TolC family protein [Bacteroidota bacterium]